MADLTTDYAGLTLKNPIISAASSLGNHIDKLKRLELAGVGAVTTKLISSAVQPPEHEFPYRSVVHKDSWALLGDQNLSQEYGVALVKAAKKELRIPVIANFVGVEANVDIWVQNALALQDAGADALEMDLYCPMSGLGTSISEHGDSGHGYMSICAVPDQLGKVMRALVDVVRIPVIPKMNPAVMSITAVASALIDNGATTITMSNCMGGNPGVDIFNKGKSLLPFAIAVNDMPYMGSFLFPIHNRNLVILKDTYGDKVRVSSGGGIYNWNEILQRIMLGAHSVQLASTLFENGLSVIRKCTDGLHSYLDQYGYKSLEDIRGMSLSTVGTRAQSGVETAVARIKDPVACLSCADTCVDKVSADCLAMSMGENGVPKINIDRCTGCGWCVHHCGTDAIELVKSKNQVDVWNLRSELTSSQVFAR
jgi:dihydropyrimidine dehydrogenase (NAD+) subunit PreA